MQRFAYAALSLLLTACIARADADHPWPASEFRGFNWSDPRDNFVDGRIVPSGINPQLSAEEVARDARRLLAQLKELLHANTVRLAINPDTVLERSAWERHQAVISAARTGGLAVMLACWESASKRDGRIDDRQRFDQMWRKVVTHYASDTGVYFEAFNEPFGYPDRAWRDLAAEWVERQAKLAPRARLVVSGSGYNERLTRVGADPRLDGCLLSFHCYSWFGRHPSEDLWGQEVQQRIGHANKERTIVTEWGATMVGRPQDFYQQANGRGRRSPAYLRGMSQVIREWRLGSLYWPGLRDRDRFSLTARQGDSLGLTITNRSGLERLLWSFGEPEKRPSLPSEPSASAGAASGGSR